MSRVKVGDLVKVKKFIFDKSDVAYYPGRVIYIFTNTKFGTDDVDCEVEYCCNGEKKIDTFNVDKLDFDVQLMREKILKELGI